MANQVSLSTGEKSARSLSRKSPGTYWIRIRRSPMGSFMRAGMRLALGSESSISARWRAASWPAWAAAFCAVSSRVGVGWADVAAALLFCCSLYLSTRISQSPNCTGSEGKGRFFSAASRIIWPLGKAWSSSRGDIRRVRYPPKRPSKAALGMSPGFSCRSIQLFGPMPRTFSMSPGRDPKVSRLKACSARSWSESAGGLTVFVFLAAEASALGKAKKNNAHSNAIL